MLYKIPMHCSRKRCKVMNELSLFSGAGGGLLGTKLLGFNHVGYVEFNDYCQQVIAQRIKDGYLDEAPIFSDIRAFNDQGYAKSYKGMVDVITAGFPCQPFSSAGKQLGENDPKNMWPETIKCISQIRPAFCFLENVANLLKPISGRPSYFGRVQSDLAQHGYNAIWTVLGADDIGARHHRKRVWILAYNQSKFEQSREMVQKKGYKGKPRGIAGNVSRNIWSSGWKINEPEMVGSSHDLADRVERTKAIGNGQVPTVVQAAWNILINNQPGA